MAAGVPRPQEGGQRGLSAPTETFEHDALESDKLGVACTCRGGRSTEVCMHEQGMRYDAGFAAPVLVPRRGLVVGHGQRLQRCCSDRAHACVCGGCRLAKTVYA